MERSFLLIFMMYSMIATLMWIVRGVFFEFPTRAAFWQGYRWLLLLALFMSMNCYFRNHCPPIPHFVFEEPPLEPGGEDWVPLLQQLRLEKEKSQSH